MKTDQDAEGAARQTDAVQDEECAIEAYHPRWMSRKVLNQQARRNVRPWPVGFKPRRSAKVDTNAVVSNNEKLAGAGPEQVFVKTLTGKFIMIEIGADDTVDQLKAKVYDKERSPPDQQILICSGELLGNGIRLAECGVRGGAILHLALRLCGGMQHERAPAPAAGQRAQVLRRPAASAFDEASEDMGDAMGLAQLVQEMKDAGESEERRARIEANVVVNNHKGAMAKKMAVVVAAFLTFYGVYATLRRWLLKPVDLLGAMRFSVFSVGATTIAVLVADLYSACSKLAVLMARLAASYDIYDAMRPRMVPAPLISFILQLAKSPDSPYFVDGMHLNERGIQALAPLLQNLALRHSVDCFVSDSSLCAVRTVTDDLNAESADWYGTAWKELLPMPVVPAWGKSFTCYGFWNHVWKNVRASTRKLGVICAGNDIHAGVTGDYVAWHIEHFIKRCNDIGIGVVIFDAVPVTDRFVRES